MPQLQRCPLCSTDCPSNEGAWFYRDSRRVYLRCSCCYLIFVPPEFHLTAKQERAEYDLHDNQSNDLGYRRFLGRLYEPLVARLAPAAKGLDFGCGPGPTLSVMLQEAGFSVALYDVFYVPDRAVLGAQYDFITATEVVEHLHDPQLQLAQLWDCLVDTGVLAIMTKLALDADAFSRWHYKNDQTHVCFFSRQTFEFLAERFNATLEFMADDVVFLTKNKT
ncbi:class I SAM-dependent methyltransferase [Gilvimarinus polysaccharolyticus]|uniref:class I SAM-dependent methyltransferase n=1 Tax=Gilvimarinus polysaccharolyticus TaxID=863921 RepID=UPI000673BCC3|nr:class I SAM-dependent methyltransferase [Gilvimarinus polysaccharolyticus]